MAISDKQKNILLKNGYTLEAIDRLTYQQVSKAIGDIFAQPKTEQVKVATEVKASSNDRETSFKVAYAKDLAVAMIHECALFKVDFRDVEVMKAITDNSIMMVSAMWARL